MTAAAPHGHEPHDTNLSSTLNWLRAGVLGANDGIISTAGLLIGVAAAGATDTALFAAGVAAVVAGAVSMALGEYVSVSAQRDTERELVTKESQELAEMPEAEHRELVDMLVAKGIRPDTAEIAAQEMAEHDLLKIHLDLELGINAEELTSPLVAAGSSALSFVLGAVLPLLAIVLAPSSVAIWVCFAATLLALLLTAVFSARISGAPLVRSTARLVLGGALAMGVTYIVGDLFGVAVG